MVVLLLVELNRVVSEINYLGKEIGINLLLFFRFYFGLNFVMRNIV